MESIKALTALAAVCLALTVTACSATKDADTHAGPPVAVTAIPAPTGEPLAARVVQMDGTLAAPFFLPSVEEFARSSMITDVVTGTVIKTEPIVVEPGTEVYTQVTIEVESGQVAKSGDTLITRELGGVVTLGQVAKDFEAHLAPSKIEREADTLVDYRIDDQPHSMVGDKVLLFLGGQPTGDGGQFTAARMQLDSDQTYQWVGEPANQDWAKTLDPASAAKLFGLRG